MHAAYEGQGAGRTGLSPWDTPQLCGEGSACRDGRHPSGARGAPALPQPPGLACQVETTVSSQPQGAQTSGPSWLGQSGLCSAKALLELHSPGGELPSEEGGGLCIGACPQPAMGCP